ncbi:hypothetical protein KY289_012518 [Solanum tuberosum]|nr:hypothetical protein KY289_012518 [Solanum tuberosum]
MITATLDYATFKLKQLIGEVDQETRRHNHIGEVTRTRLAWCDELDPEHFFLVHKHDHKGLPNGSMGLPLIGETYGFCTPHKSFSIGNFLQQHCSRYGKIFKSNIFGAPTIVSCDLELNTFVLQNEGKLFQSSYPKPVKNILGKHSLLLLTDFDRHKRFRSIEMSLINKFKCTPHFFSHLDKLCLSLMESWRGNQFILFFKQAKQFSFSMILMSVLEMEPGEPLGLELLKDFLTFMKGFVSIPINLPWTHHGKAIKARSRIVSTLKQILKEKDSFNEIMLLKGKLSDVEKVSIVLDLLFAGFETTSGLLSLLVYFLAKSSQALQNLKDEHRTLRRKKKKGEPLNWEDYKQMEFTMMVINETLRCGNLVKFVLREAIKGVDFKGYHIPAGWKILPIFSSMHLDPSLHENPSEFNPWRWADPATSKNVTPFGGGLRMCPGSELAKLEAAFFLHHLVLNYRYGKVFKSYIFGSPTIISCDLELNKFVLQKEGKLFQSSYPKPIRDILGKHSLMIVTDVERHKKLRRIEVGLINKFSSTSNFLGGIDKLCISLMESWRGNQLILFSKQAKQLLEDFLTFMKGFVSIPINLPWTPYAKAVKARTRISATLKQILNEWKNRKDVQVQNGQQKGDPFDEILVKEDLISDVEKVSILLDLLLAGYETTSGLLSLLVYFLAQSPQALQTLKDEHLAIRKKKKEGEPLNWEDYKQMEFTTMVINETLRCGNLVKFVHREAIKDVKFKGYHIPAGWKVLPILSAVHLEPSLHENPSEFNPWRWTDPATSHKVVPFGGGSRLCPGSELGKLEASFFLHYLLLNYRWTMKEEEYPMLYPYMDFPKGLLIALETETKNAN